MRRGIASLLIIVILGLIVIVIIVLLLTPWWYQFVKSWPDRQVARQIPRYEDTERWRLDAGCQDFGGGGPCSATIDFKTNDNFGKVATFYKEKLAAKGWLIDEENYIVDIKGNKQGRYIIFTRENDVAQLVEKTSGDSDFNFYFDVSRE